MFNIILAPVHTSLLRTNWSKIVHFENIPYGVLQDEQKIAAVVVLNKNKKVYLLAHRSSYRILRIVDER